MISVIKKRRSIRIPKWARILLAVAACAAVVFAFMVCYVQSLFRGPDYADLPEHYPFKSSAARAPWSPPPISSLSPLPGGYQ